MTCENTYLNIQQKYADLFKDLSQKDNLFSWIRALIFLYFVGMSIYFIQGKAYNFFLLNLVFSIALFLFCVSKHQNIINQKSFCLRVLKLLEDELLKIGKNFDYANIDSDTFIENEHPYSADLDIFGKESLFNRIDRTKTKNGKNLLIQKLKSLIFDTNELYQIQNAVQELANKKAEWSFNFLAAINNENHRELNENQTNHWNGLRFYNHFRRPIIIGISSLNLLVLVLSINNFLPSYLFLLLLIVNYALHYLFFKDRTQTAEKIAEYKDFFSSYLSMLKILEKENFESEKLKQHKQLLSIQGKNFIKNFDAFIKEVNALEASIKNPFVNFFNLFFYIDIWYMKNISDWNEKHQYSLSESIGIINEVEVLISYAQYANVYACFNYPTFSNDETFQLEAKSLGHPLITQSKCIVNDFQIRENKLFIITGANMAGKSTFLRTVGVNIVLALNGLPVFADSLKLKPIQLFTSMRAMDSLDKNSSYFLSEVKRLKQLMDGIKEGKKYFVILDEILTGTNSNDKLEGSKLFIEKIIKSKQVTGLLATHDIPLTKLQEQYADIICNYKFEADILGDEDIMYDYKLKEGVVKQMNAMHLMKILDII